MFHKAIIAAGVLAMSSGSLHAAGCTDTDFGYSLYRQSPVLDEPVYVAAFDWPGDVAYNRANCHIARDLFQGQPGVTVKYWCEAALICEGSVGALAALKLKLLKHTREKFAR